MADRKLSQRVLQDLSRAVGGMADATEHESGILAQVEGGEHTYLQLAERMLTGANELPMGMGPALETLNQLAMNLEGVSGAVADQQSARARELEEVNKKEQEEKEDGGGGGGGEDAEDSEEGDGATGEQGGGDDGDDTRTRDDEPIPEADPPGETGGDGTTTTPPSSGGGGPGTRVPPPTLPPERPTPPVTPEPPERAGGDVVIAKKRTRRCFKFRLYNGTNKPVSDLHFDGADLSMASSSVGKPNGLSGWKPYNVPGGNGFWFGVDPEDGQPVPPGGVTGHFEFCSESSPRGFDIRMTHPDGTATPIGPDGIRVGGRPARRHNGQTMMPPESAETIYELDVQVTETGKSLRVRSSGRMNSGPASGRADPYDAWVPKGSPREIEIGSVPPGRGFRAGETVRVTVTSPSASLRFSVRSGGGR